MIRALLVGATGRMGRAIITAAQDTSGIEISGAVASPGSAYLGRDAGEQAGVARLGVAITGDLAAELANADVVIDFSQASATAAHLGACRKAGKPLVVGTTGHGAGSHDGFQAAAREIPLLVAPNTSLGVTLLLELAQSAAAALPLDFDAEIIEAHHRTKTDAPSGTALALGDAVAEGRAQELSAVAVFERHGKAPRRAGDIGFAVIRGGDLVGEHTVLFAGPGESLSLSHRATDRGIFARGALQAAAWLAAQPKGLYSMRDIFRSKTVS